MNEKTVLMIIGIIILIIVSQSDFNLDEDLIKEPSSIITPDINTESGSGFVSVEAISGIDSPIVINFYVPKGMPQYGQYPKSEVLIKINDVNLLETSQLEEINGKITIDKKTNTCIVSGVSSTCLINGNSELINSTFSNSLGNVIMIGNYYGVVKRVETMQFWGCYGSPCSNYIPSPCGGAIGWENIQQGSFPSGYCGPSFPSGCQSGGKVNCYGNLIFYSLSGTPSPIYHSVKYFIGGGTFIGNNRVITLEVQAGGDFNLFDLKLSEETQPKIFYDAFSRKEETFNLSKGEKVTYIGNIDVSKLNGTITYQVAISGKYKDNQGVIYNTKKYSKSQIINYDNGVEA